MFEMTCRSYEEQTISVADVNALIQQQLANLGD